MARLARLLCVLGVLSLSAPAFAAPLNLPQAFPDFAALTQVTTTYDTVTDAFSVTGFLSQYTGVDLVSHTAVGSFTLDAVIDDTGAITGGTLTINGVVLDGIAGPPADDLLIVDLTDFGFSGTGPSTVFEFTGDTTGGTMAALFPKGAGVILNPGTTSYAGAFDVDFTGSGGTVDAFYIPDNPIPEPASIMLLLSGGAFIAATRKRRNRRN